MWWIIGISVFALISAILILREAIRDAAESMSDDITRMYDGDAYIGEYSPLNIDADKTLKVLSLRKKLDDIEKDRQKGEVDIDKFGDFDNRINGK